MDEERSKANEALNMLRSGQFEDAVEALVVGDLPQKEVAEGIKIYHAELVAQAAELRESQALLQESVVRFQNLFEAIPLAVFVTDRYGLISRANSMARETFGLRVSKSARSLLSRILLTDEARTSAQRALDSVATTGQSIARSLEFVCPTKGRFLGDLYLERLIRTPNSADEDSIICVVVDLTERLEAEEQQRLLMATLKERDREIGSLAHIVRTTKNLVVLSDELGRITWVNDAFVRGTGYSLAECQGKTPGQLLQGPGTDPQAVRRMRELLRRGEPVTQLEILNYSRSGRPYWLLLDIQPIKNEQGIVESFVSVQIDITEQKESQLALRRSEAFQRAVFEADPDLVAVLRPDGVVLQLNANGARMLGYPDTSAIVMHHVEKLVPVDQLAKLKAAVTSAMLGVPGDFSTRLRKFDGSDLDARLFFQPYTIQNNLEGVVLIARDLAIEMQRSALEAKTAALEAAAMAKTRFMAHISHEFRTPLNAILGFTQLVDKAINANQSDKAISYAQHVLHAGEHLLAMIDDLLDLSKVESSNLSLKVEDVPVDEIADATIELLSRHANEAGVNLRFASPTAPVVVRADRQRLQQVLTNLVSNAIKYNHKDGMVEIAAGNDAGKAWIEVRDDGSGLTAEQQAHLFESFNRLGAEGTAIKGTGIGLVITKQLVELMNGKLSVSSRPGEGSVFRVDLVASQAHSIEAGAATDASGDAVVEHAVNAGKQFRIVCVEDNESNRKFFTAALELIENAQFKCYEDAETALTGMKQNVPDVVLFDAQLPGMSGIELRSLMNEDSVFLNTKSVMVTADATEEKARLAKLAGFDAVIHKPVDIGHLISTISRLLR
jgi:PAS domain S-box-containing protein